MFPVEFVLYLSTGFGSFILGGFFAISFVDPLYWYTYSISFCDVYIET